MPPKHIDGRKKAEDILRANSGRNWTTKTEIFSSSQLAEIEECEKDENGEYTGKASVRLLSTPGVRKHCIIPVFAGQSFWFGGLPQPGTLCLVSWLPLGIGIITAIYPFSFRQLIRVRALQDLIPGEILIQSATGILKEDQKPAGKILLDRDGGVTLQNNTEDEENKGKIVLGNPGGDNGLSSESNPNDEISGEEIAIQLSVGDTKINITKSGSVIINAEKIFIGDGNSHKKLATEDFVDDIYNKHTHAAGAMAVPGVGPVTGITTVPTLSGSSAHLTSKTKAE